jgi:hypothetical protein
MVIFSSSKNKKMMRHMTEEDQVKRNKRKVYLSVLCFKLKKYKSKDKTPIHFDKIHNLNKNHEEDPDYFLLSDIIKKIIEEHDTYKIEKSDKGMTISLDEGFSNDEHICGWIKYGE